MAGGTSFDAPIFAGMLAVINQAKGYTAASGQGVINPTLYTLAANATTYASAFHDVTSGGNECAAGTTYCGSGVQTTDYAATTGYDEASGLGSVDLYNLLSAWPSASTTTSSLAASTTTLTAASTTPALGASDVINITVASDSSSITTTPTGTLSVAVDGTTETSSLAITSGSASYTFSSTITGSHTITATYSGDSNYAASSSTLTVTVPATTTVESFSVAATSVAVAAGSSGTSTITVTPAGGYTETVDWAVSVNADSATLADACYTISDTGITGTAAVSTVLTIYTSSSNCTNATAAAAFGKKRAFTRRSTKVSSQPESRLPGSPERTTILTPGVLLAFLVGRNRYKTGRLLFSIICLAVIGSLSGCGSGSSGSTNEATGMYSMIITGTDSANSSLTASADFTLTIQ